MKNHYTIALIALMVVIAFLVLPVSAATSKDGNGVATLVLNKGATVFIGEQGLDITNVVGTAPAQIAWWASGADTTYSSPSQTITISDASNFDVLASQFAGYTGSWYIYDGTTGTTHPLAFYVQDPNLDISVWDANTGTGTNMNDKTVVVGQNLTFKISTNMYTVVSDSSKREDTKHTDATTVNQPNASFKAIYTGTTNNDAIIQFVVNSSYNAPNQWVYTIYPHGGTTVIQTITSQNPTINFGATPYGTIPCYYDVTLKVTNAGGLSSTETATIYVNYGSVTITSASTDYTGTSIVTPESNAPSATDPLLDGYITIKVKPDSGNTYTSLYNVTKYAQSTEDLYVSTSPYYWPGSWSTGAYDQNGQRAYPAGVYKVWAESMLNKMKDNYKSNSGADYTGKTVSTTYTITIVSDSLKLTANKESVVRSNPFSVTLTGSPDATYNMWVKGTSTMDGVSYNEVPPQINSNQEGVVVGSTDTANYKYQNGAGNTVSDNVPNLTNTNITVNPYYAAITTDDSGVRTVELITTANTKAEKYTIHVERNIGTDSAPVYKSDELDVKVEEGTVTIVAAGDQSYYLGEEVKFSGTNTESAETFLFITGPNLKAYGSQIQSDDPRNNAVVTNKSDTFQIADVNSDNTWEYKWGTASIALDAGTYTIYAVSQPKDKDNLENTAYGTVSVVIKKPFISATVSSSTVAKGDRVYITGTAQGQPSQGVMVWILGKNYEKHTTESVNSDASFSYEIQQTTTADLSSGQYFVVAQHPMQNNQFDVYASTSSDGDIVMTKDQSGGTADKTDFKLTGANSLQGSDAAEALIEAINDANVDDTYTKLQFLVEEPLITVEEVGTRHVGDKFTITANTNLAVDDEILCEVYSSSFNPTQKTQSGEFSGATGTVKVQKGDAGTGLNKISFDVDATTFKADEYLVTFSAIIQDATGTALFNVLDANSPAVNTSAVTTVVATVATPVPTPIVTAIPTTVEPTTTKTPTQPGFGALVALIGLGAVALIVVRRH
jgi:PGF-CTERM protein